MYFWLFKNRYNITSLELWRFLKKPTVKKIALRYIKNICYLNNVIEVSFNNIEDKLYWPAQYNLEYLYQVCAEAFDVDDWHNYESEVTQVKDDDIIIDIGAAEGLFSLSKVKKCKKIYIVEPNEVFFNTLNETFSKYKPEKVELFNVAIGNKESSVKINENSISSTISESKDGDKRITSLDNLLNGKDKITFLKADVEGYEMELLKGATKIIKNNKPKMSITCYHKENRHEEIINFVKNLIPEYKYKLRGITQFDGKPVIIHFYI